MISLIFEIKPMDNEPISMRQIIHGDALTELRKMPAGYVYTCVTSPPYWGLRDYGEDDQLGLEPTPDEYVARLVGIMAEVKRVLRDDGTLWLNLGDSYAGGAGGRGDGNSEIGRADGTTGRPSQKHNGKRIPRRVESLKPKDLVGVPWRMAFALQADGWYLRSDIIWVKPNPMPESVTDRPTKSHEYIFLLTKQARYYYDAEAIAEMSSGLTGGAFGPNNPKGTLRQDTGRERPPDSGKRNRRTVWTVPTQPYSGAHFAVFPPKLIEPCIRAGCPAGGIVLDPFLGSGTTAAVAKSLGRDYIGIELNAEYIELAKKRIRETQDVLFGI